MMATMATEIEKTIGGLPVGERIKRLMALKGVTAADMAEALDMTRQNLYIKLNTDWKTEEIRGAAKVLGIDPKELI